jgi:hypothetical protein
MAKLRSAILRNYRRFAGEILLPFDQNVNMIVIPAGQGKTSILEAVSWCLLGTDLVSQPDQIPNADALGAGMAEVLVGLEFTNGERLERFAQFSCIDDKVEQQRWGWRLVEAGSGKVIEEGSDGDDFADQQERLYPEICVHAGLISGPQLDTTLQGCPSGVERGVQCSNVWCTTDLSLRSSMEATSLFLALRPEAPVDCLGYDPDGRLELQIHGTLDRSDIHLALLSHALAFAKESARVCPIFIDDPFSGVSDQDRQRLFNALLDAMKGCQLIFLLSEGMDTAALRATGRVDKELEIRG